MRFVDIPEAITQGETKDECEFNGAEVLFSLAHAAIGMEVFMKLVANGQPV